jgi:8-oxo-dGTP diphosphatase
MRDGHILLAKRARAPKIGEWDLIGGFVEPGETVPEAARREAREEIGLEIAGLKRLHQAPGEYVPGKPTLNFMYVASVEGEPTPSDDVAEVRWFALDALPELAWTHETEAVARLQQPDA